MKNPAAVRLAVWLTLALVGSATAQVTNLQGCMAAYASARLAIAAETRRAELGLLKAYTNDLQVLRGQAQQAGDLDALKAIMDELTRCGDNGTLPTAPPQIPQISALADGYKARVRALGDQKAASLLALARRYDLALENLQRKFTQDGLVRDAVDVQDERKRLQEEIKPAGTSVVAAAPLAPQAEPAGRVPAPGGARGSAPPLPGLVLYYPLDDAPGTRIEDASGRGNHGEAQGVVFSTKSKHGGAAEFDGTTARICVGSGPQMNTDRSFVAWVRPERWEGKGLPVFTCGVTGRGVGDFIRLNRGNPKHWEDGFCKLVFDHWGTPGFDSESVIRLRAWNHLAVTYQLKQTLVSIYVDGKLVGQQRAEMANYNLNSVVIGGNLIGGNTAPFFAGSMDDVMVFDRALSGQEIQDLFKGNWHK
jgi:hypothetical protein